MRCEKCGRDFEQGEHPHLFAGWGYFVAYCPGCCPHVVEDHCDHDHPDDEVQPDAEVPCEPS